jgi:hypothetical protein
MPARSSSRRFFRPALESLECRLPPTVTLSVSDPLPFPKPDTGQLTGLFVVTRSGDLAPAVARLTKRRSARCSRPIAGRGGTPGPGRRRSMHSSGLTGGRAMGRARTAWHGSISGKHSGCRWS